MLPWNLPRQLNLLNLPTPVETLKNPENLWIKRDDLTGMPYGGNKPRKLEFLLADAKANGAKTIVTTGATGSNHCLATTVYGRREGLDVRLIMFPQPETDIVRHHFKMVQKLGAQVTLGTDYSEFDSLKSDLLNRLDRPYFIPAGGSCGLGCMGYVKAAYELKTQILNGQLPQPEVVYCAAGTLGTLAGLAVGLKLVDLPVVLRGIRVVDTIVTNQETLNELITETLTIIRSLNPERAIPDPSELSVEIVEGYFGTGYGERTPAGSEAMNWLHRRSSVRLDPTYTSKTFAAVIDAVDRLESSAPVLYWHTFDPGHNLGD